LPVKEIWQITFQTANVKIPNYQSGNREKKEQEP
jgi:hypothetical protein